MHPGILALLLVVTPFAGFAISPKPMASYCEQPEVIIPNVPQEQVLNDLTGRLRSQGNSVLVTVPDTPESCLARCAASSAPPESAQRRACVSICTVGDRSEPRSAKVDIVMADRQLVDQPPVAEPDGSGRQTLQNVRVQYVLSEARSGVRVEAALGIVSFPGSDHELITDYTRGSANELRAALARMAGRYGSPAVPLPPGAAEHEAAVKAAVGEIEKGRPPHSFVFSEATDQITRRTIGSFRPLIALANVPRSPQTGLPAGYALVQKVEVKADDAIVQALVGPTGPNMECGSPITVHLKSKRVGWSICGRAEAAC